MAVQCMLYLLLRNKAKSLMVMQKFNSAFVSVSMPSFFFFLPFTLKKKVKFTFLFFFLKKKA